MAFYFIFEEMGPDVEPAQIAYTCCLIGDPQKKVFLQTAFTTKRTSEAQRERKTDGSPSRGEV